MGWMVVACVLVGARMGALLVWRRVGATLAARVVRVHRGRAGFVPPDEFGLAVREVAIAVPGGVAPACLIDPAGPGRSDTWAIHIRDGTDDGAALARTLAATTALGMRSLLVSYRGDGDGPSPPGGVSTLGLSEWEDVDAAIAFARNKGAQRVVLVGSGLGGAIALQLTERSRFRAFIDRLVLIGPVTDWRAVIRQGARARGLPEWMGGLTVRALADRRVSRRVGLAGPIDFGRLDWSRPGRLTVPALVIHSTGDRTVPLRPSVLFAMANPRLVTLVELAPGEHGREHDADPVEFDRAITRFLRPHP